MILWVRNILFWMAFIIITLMYFVLMMASGVLPARYRHHVGVSWVRCFVWLLKVFIGLDFRVEGRENIPNEPSIICCKHQSGYETLALQLIFPHQVFVMKKELLYIPIIGLGLMLMSPIAIDRSQRSKATKQILEQGKVRKEKGFWISIFPEGTRTKPGEIGQYKKGAARMAQALQMNIVPVAVNSGNFWPRNSFLKYPGTITFAIMPSISWNAGTVEEITDQYAKTIETAQRAIENQTNTYE